jgi:starch synthase
VARSAGTLYHLRSHVGPSVLIASPEIVPFAKTGGLGDVLGALPGALAAQGADVSLVMPAYRQVMRGGYHLEDAGMPLTIPIANRWETGSVLKGKTGDEVPVYFVRADGYFDRDYLYGAPDGDFPDNLERFTFFSRAVLEVARRIQPQVLHVNDWQAAMAIAFLKAQPSLYASLASVKTVMTVHNLGYQGRFWNVEWPLLNLDRGFFTPRFIEFYDDINFLKGGIIFSDAITTVSPTYAEEIKTPEQGFGLDGVFRERASRLFGILNGVDYRIWDPAKDTAITRRYSAVDMTGKAGCKADLQRYLGLEENGSAPVIGMVTRLSDQKGLDLVQSTLPSFLARGCQFVLLGSGDARYQDLFASLARLKPEQVGVEIGFSESVAHKVIAGSDILLMPSRYEPGGLTQLYSLKYGTVPLVRSTGGLKDTVIPFSAAEATGNGFLFTNYEPGYLVSTMDHALEIFRDKGCWQSLMKNAMSADFSWERSARGYLDIYSDLVRKPLHS